MSTIYKPDGDILAKLFLGVGHGGNDPGAVGYIREEDVNLNMAIGEKDYLVANGVEVCMSRTKDENDPLTEVIKECNAYDPDLAHDCHNNAGGGDGFEVFYHYKGGLSKTLAVNIEAEVKKIGQNSRGCKIKKNANGKDYFGFIRQTNAPAVITEGVFVDNKADASQADTLAEQREFGYAYARGILKTLGIADNGLNGSGGSNGSSGNADGSFLVKVTTNALNIRKGAGKKYKRVGVIRDRGVYTIVKVDGDWGKLKSGAGWIHLGYTEKV